ncbi:hypothetical protein ZIOFF_052007 [Zingiber officinale]|uniref:Protein ENHANCED DISEASE RESISTANCE 2 C-terminal domain-containing protein n=1 Tax=Zingiber officinale TaxID=94328 RepID=A0A8J5KSV5_ZINOF|nr:hypothetical protein ZIOFF_052007 [Zingiber officinale]
MNFLTLIHIYHFNFSGLKEYFGANPSLTIDTSLTIVEPKVSDASTAETEFKDSEMADEFFDATASSDSLDDEDSDDEIEISKGAGNLKLKNVSWAILALRGSKVCSNPLLNSFSAHRKLASDDVPWQWEHREEGCTTCQDMCRECKALIHVVDVTQKLSHGCKYSSKLLAAGVTDILFMLGICSKNSLQIGKINTLSLLERSELDANCPSITIDPRQFHGSMVQGKAQTDTNCWSSPNGHGFMIRGKNYLKDYSKIVGGDPLLKLIAVDWFKADNNSIDKVALHPKSLVQPGRTDLSFFSYQSKAGKALPFILIVNLEIPSKPNYSLVLYYAAEKPLSKHSLLGRFVDGTDMFRDSRFKLIPSIVEGYWMVKRAVGTKACLLGKAVTCKYLRQDNFLETLAPRRCSYRHGPSAAVAITRSMCPPRYPYIDAGGEQLWIEVLREMLEHGLTLCLCTNFLCFTVGGTLSNVNVSWGKNRYGVLPRSAKVRYERSVLVDALHLDPLMSDYRVEAEHIDVEIGSSSVARSIISLVIGYITSIVVDLAILIEAKEENELPEYILGTVRLNQVRLESAVPYWGES